MARRATVLIPAALMHKWPGDTLFNTLQLTTEQQAFARGELC